MPREARRGFTLFEVLVATTIMALMIVSLLSFVQLGSEIWIRGEQSINMTNLFSGISDLLSRDLLYARAIVHPTSAEGTLTYLDYDSILATGTTIGTATFRVVWNSTTKTLSKIIQNYDTTSTLNGKIVPTVASETVGKIARERYEYQIARDVATFAVTRVSDWTVAVQIGMQSIDYTSTATEGVILCATNTFFAPGAR